ncbi:MAG TPA: helix-turn-helix transcriptional regulator [Pyrinomonadaceae bacterium]|nr:helix-turn-helix transcriptional regulator [Pyrinomonadaceae bacterium]
MGARARHRPKRLAEKLRRIREAFDLSQNEMIRRMGAEKLMAQNTISEYELGKREPPLLVLLKYAEAAGICLDVLANDELDLPAKLPARPKHRA